MYNGSNQPNYPGDQPNYPGDQPNYPQPQPPPPPPPPQQQAQQNRVKVEDALSYLEEVKNEFHQRPEVYTQFLDIMKDFKSQAIDTPGVIQRVSSLFNEYPRLILGFNAFLPPGFEVRYIDDRICVIHPNREYEEVGRPGYYHSIDVNGYEGGEEEDEEDYDDEHEEDEQEQEDEEEEVEGEDEEEEEEDDDDEEENEDEEIEDEEEVDDEEETDDENEDEDEEIDDIYTHNGRVAYSLIKKVQARFVDQHNVYVQFLDLLVYHLKADNDPTPMEKLLNTRGRVMDEKTRTEFVISSVTRLFASEPDLIEDFLKIVSVTDDSYIDTDGSSESSDESSDSDEIDQNDEVEQGDEIKIENEELDDHKEENEQEKVWREKRKKNKKKVERRMEDSVEEDESTLKRVYDMINFSDAQLYSRLQESLELNDIKKVLLLLNLFVSKKLSRFDLLRGLRDVLNLKCTNLFADICDLLGFSADLKEFAESDESNAASISAASSPNKSIYPSRRSFTRDGEQLARDINESTIACLGVSYRHIQRNEKVKCSGRTQLCDEVLNDEWTSYPSWSSEDNGNVSSKKSPYEEFLYRTEDERFELDIVLDVNKYAIESLELINRKMEKMSDHDKSLFKLDLSYNVTSVCLLTRAIRRIYGEAASHIMTGLRDNPVVAVPRILQRCQEKEREWRESQTQMNKVWREQLEKQLIRSLDHQTALTKQADARLLKPKSMIHQIEQFFDTRQGKDPENDVGPHVSLSYPEKRKILHDVNDIMIHYLKRQPGYSKDDKRRMKIILRKIVLEWFCEKPADMSDDEKDEELDLDKKKGRREGSRDDKLEYNSKDERINLINYYADDETDEWPVDMKFSTHQEKAPIDEFLKDQENVGYRVFFGDDSMYIFIRLHHTLTDRFSRFHAAYVRKCDDFHDQHVHKRQWETETAKSNNKLLAKVEKDWGVLDEKLNVLRRNKNSPIADYHLMLCDVKRYLNGELDASAFEDTLRSTFPSEGCLLLSIDKILMQAVKTLSTLANNEDECSAMKMYMKHRFRKPPTGFLTTDFVEGVEQAYQRMAEERLHGKNCFKFEMINDKGEPTISLTLLDTEDSDEEMEDDNLAASSASGAESISGEKPSTSGSILSENPRKRMWDGRVRFDDEDEEYIRNNRSDKSRRTIMRGRQSGYDKTLSLKRCQHVRGTAPITLFNYEAFENFENSPSSEHRGGFFIRKSREKQIQAIQKMQVIRRDRCRIINFHSTETCDLLELNSVKSTNNPNSHPDFSFLVANLYKSA